MIKQQLSILFQKRCLPVVFLLRFEVGNQFWLVVKGIRESSIPFLPTIEIREDMIILNPDGRRDFDVLHQIRQRNGRAEAKQNVDMVPYAI
jgi:hypothetical protein